MDETNEELQPLVVDQTLSDVRYTLTADARDERTLTTGVDAFNSYYMSEDKKLLLALQDPDRFEQERAAKRARWVDGRDIWTTCAIKPEYDAMVLQEGATSLDSRYVSEDRKMLSALGGPSHFKQERSARSARPIEKRARFRPPY